MGFSDRVTVMGARVGGVLHGVFEDVAQGLGSPGRVAGGQSFPGDLKGLILQLHGNGQGGGGLLGEGQEALGYPAELHGACVQAGHAKQGG